jgi:hypothetical protein
MVLMKKVKKYKSKDIFQEREESHINESGGGCGRNGGPAPTCWLNSWPIIGQFPHGNSSSHQFVGEGSGFSLNQLLMISISQQDVTSPIYLGTLQNISVTVLFLNKKAIKTPVHSF